MIALLLAAVLCPHPHRSRAVVEEFIKSYRETHEGNSCPIRCATFRLDGKGFHPYQRCGACQADHRCPLACGGVDAPENLDWLTARANRKKGADCSACVEPFTICGVRR